MKRGYYQVLNEKKEVIGLIGSDREITLANVKGIISALDKKYGKHSLMTMSGKTALAMGIDISLAVPFPDEIAMVDIDETSTGTKADAGKEYLTACI